MAKTLHLRLSGQAEKFIEDISKKGLTERDVIAKALWLFEIAWKTQRIALLNEEYKVEYVFTSQPFAEAAETSNYGAVAEKELTEEEKQLREIFGKPAREKKTSKQDAAPEGGERKEL